MTSLSAAVEAPKVVAAPQAASAPRVPVIGWLLVLCALSLGLSAFPGLRLAVSSMLVHPINFGVAFLALVVVPMRLRAAPDHVLVALLSFYIFFVFSAAIEDRSLTPILKLSAAVVTLLAVSLSVVNEVTFRWAATGFAISVSTIAARALTGADEAHLGGINPLQGIANENAFSLYALPALLVCTYMTMQSRTPKLMRALFAMSAVVSVLALFSTANRSGWLGAMLVPLLLSLRAVRRMRTFLLLAAFIGITAYLVLSIGNVRMIEFNVNLTEEGYASDRLRFELFLAGVNIGLANPILGVSPQRLPAELSHYLGLPGTGLEAHNVFSLLLGGSGLLTLIAFLALGVVLWVRPKGEHSQSALDAHFLLRCMLVLWCARGTFGHEIIYSPSFSLGLGLCLGLCFATGLWRRRSRRSLA